MFSARVPAAYSPEYGRQEPRPGTADMLDVVIGVMTVEDWGYLVDSLPDTVSMPHRSGSREPRLDEYSYCPITYSFTVLA